MNALKLRKLAVPSFLILGWLLAGRCLAAVQSPPAVPLELNHEMEAIRKRADLPGIAAMAVWEGRVVALGCAGVRSVASGEPLRITDPFALGSCGKAMTSTLIAVHIESGELDWDTTLEEGLPELAASMDAGYREVTVEQLLRHRGGIAERTNPALGLLVATFDAIPGSPRDQRFEIAQRVLSASPTKVPGTSTEYSNYGYMIAAAVLERRTGRSWEEMIVADVFEPLGLRSAGTGSPAGDSDPVGHKRVDDRWIAMAKGPRSPLPSAMSPAGLEHMNLRDWARFVQAHIAGERGKDGLVTSATIRRLHDVSDGNGYACGFGVVPRAWGKGEVWTHTGSDGVWYSTVWAAPNLDLVLVAVSNAGDAAVPLDQAITRMIAGLGLL